MGLEQQRDGGPGQRHHQTCLGLKPRWSGLGLQKRTIPMGHREFGRGCMSPGQGHYHLVWVSHIAQHLGWAVRLEHSVLLILHHHPGRRWSWVNRS